MCDAIKIVEVNGKKNEVVLRSLKSGNHFGEIALVKNIPRTCTVRAQDEVKVIKMNANSFNFIQSSIKKKLKMDYEQNSAPIKPYA
tara:strand:- start:470 stop:727 length:258 start_codon:yes stop_codon:yes gene_type:complete